MSVFQDLYEAHLTIGGKEIQWIEIAGNAFGFASAIGGLRRQVWTWPVGIVGNVMLFAVFLGTSVNGQSTPLLGQAGRQLFFIVVSIYGWRRWYEHRKRGGGGDSAPAVQPRWATGRERLAYLAAAAVGVLVCFLVFQAIGAVWPAPTWYYWADSWIFVGSILATYAMARGWVDFWLCWIAVDLVGVPELIHFQRYPSAVLYGAYLVLVLYGFWSWLRIARAERSAEPEMEAVGL